MLHMLKDGRLVQHVTLAPTSEELSIAGVTVTAFNLGGQTTGKGSVSQKELNAQSLQVFVCSVLKRQGYREGFHWMA
ncbi:hypothetical protein GH733_006968, partial [Mirounga leonina]